MTYRYCELSAGRRFPANRPISWENIENVVPCDEEGNEISIATPSDDMLLWNRQVINFIIDGNTMYCRLKGV